ncbi:MAG: A/G-specific adenine glycosylase [Candidatus Thermoplasmatota archaeon]
MAGPDATALRRHLLRWYRQEARDLPWRRSKDPYSVWVSEIMLQQTRVDVATPYYLRWMARFPTVHALAAADLEQVLQLWSGLGYYSRARNLHSAANEVARQGMPTDAAGLHDLPGVGTYTAGAIASIAFGERVPAVDGNVVRVLARLHAWPGSASSPALKAKVAKAAAAFVPAASPGDWNQALMDLGATVCTPRNPRCGECPVAAHCQAQAKGLQDRIPAAKQAKAPRIERHAFAVVQSDGRVLLVRNPARGLLAGLWSLPGGTADRPLPELVLEQTGLVVRARGKAQPARHQFSHRTWEMAVQPARLVRTGGGGTSEAAWVAIKDLDAQALPSAMRTALAVAGVGKPKRRQESSPS